MSDDHAMSAPQSWIDSIARGEADLAAGRVVSSEEVFRKLDEAIARMQARNVAKRGPRVVGQR